jgi:DNA-binding response OmpR family regulator
MDLLAVVVTEDELLRSSVRAVLHGAGWRMQALHPDEVADAQGATCVVLDLAGRPERVLACPREPALLVVTEPGAEEMVVRALELGADDCLAKPLRPSELLARLGALARRVTAPVTPTIDRGPLRIDAIGRRAWVGSHALSLTPTELGLLEILARDAGRAFHRMELLRRVFATDLPAYARNVDCHVTRLRRKLEAAGLDPSPISTVHGTGYRFQIAAG